MKIGLLITSKTSNLASDNLQYNVLNNDCDLSEMIIGIQLYRKCFFIVIHVSTNPVKLNILKYYRQYK